MNMLYILPVFMCSLVKSYSVCKSMSTVWREVVKWPYFHITCFLVLSSVI